MRKCAEFCTRSLEPKAWLRMGILWLSCRGGGSEERIVSAWVRAIVKKLICRKWVSFGCASSVQWEERKMSDDVWGWVCSSWTRQLKVRKGKIDKERKWENLWQVSALFLVERYRGTISWSSQIKYVWVIWFDVISPFLSHFIAFLVCPTKLG